MSFLRASCGSMSCLLRASCGSVSCLLFRRFCLLGESDATKTRSAKSTKEPTNLYYHHLSLGDEKKALVGRVLPLPVSPVKMVEVCETQDGEME